MRRTTEEKADAWDVANPLLLAMYGEFSELSKKKADAAVSKAKVAMVNRLLSKCREVLRDEDDLAFLDTLDETELPQNSDVVLILSQYKAAMKRFRGTYSYAGSWRLLTDKDEDENDDDGWE